MNPLFFLFIFLFLLPPPSLPNELPPPKKSAFHGNSPKWENDFTVSKEEKKRIHNIVVNGKHHHHHTRVKSGVSQVPENAYFTYLGYNVTADNIQPFGKGICFGTKGSFSKWLHKFKPQGDPILEPEHGGERRQLLPKERPTLEPKKSKKPKKDTQIERFCLPNWVIAGMPKAGTSDFFHFLCEHPKIKCDVEELPPNKDGAITSLPGWLHPDQLTGGMWWKPIPEIVKFAKPKVFLLFRQPDDWLYSVFYFWCNSKLGEKCHKGQWSGQKKRSPERFHAILTGKNCTHFPSPDCPLRWPNFMEIFRNTSELYGRENLHIIPTEKMYEDGYSTISEAFRFLGLKKYGEEEEINQVLNTNGKRGVDHVSSHKWGLGATLKPMLRESKELLRKKMGYDKFVSELSLETGINFREYWD